jgi:ribonuclease-3
VRAVTEPVVALEAAIGWSFERAPLMHAALVHRSYCAEHADVESNERLEFLGDAVLGLVVTDFAFAQFPELPEGELAKVRAAVVNADVLAEVALGVGIGPALLLGKGEDASGGRAKPSILADAMEAVIAAVYLDGGWEAARRVVLGLVEQRIRVSAAGPGGGDFKTRLQELAAQRFEQIPRYTVRAEGPDHSKRFYAEVRVAGQLLGDGEGRSKKHAEQAAAEAAVSRLAAGALDGTAEVHPSAVASRDAGAP